MAKPVHRHKESWLTLEQTRADLRFAMPYRQSYKYRGPFINGAHASLAHAPTKMGMIDVGIAGWLLPQDACKLYEMAYFSGGDCLELGTFRGLSAAVMLAAAVAAGQKNTILSIDLDPGAAPAARAMLADRPGAKRVFFFTTDGDEALDTFTRAARQFRLCFIDHSHRYEHVRSACQKLPPLILPGGFCLFHDFNDPRNADEGNADYGVWQGVQDGLNPADFEFWGIYGCTGLYRRK